MFKESFKKSTMPIVYKNSLYKWQNVFINLHWHRVADKADKTQLCEPKFSFSETLRCQLLMQQKVEQSSVLCKYSDTIQQVQIEMQTVEQLSTNSKLIIIIIIISYIYIALFTALKSLYIWKGGISSTTTNVTPAI